MEEMEKTENIEINPKNPFRNETEFEDYNSDYGEIVPQIRLEGCKIPLFPNLRERNRIRRYYNIVGGFLLGHMALVQILFLVLGEGFLFFISLADGAKTTLPENYHSLAWDYFQNTSSYTALIMLCIGGCSILTVFLGCKATKVPISTLFQTKDFNIGLALSYIMISLLLQMITGWAAIGVEDLMEGVGISPYSPETPGYSNLKVLLLDFIYGVIVAPITEELLVRGFILKNLSRAGQRFGIIMSAFFFGVWHENISQFILAFVAGCFWGYIAIKHNSLIPSIIAHMSVNLCATIFEILDTYGWETASNIFNIIYLLLVFGGVVFLIKMMVTERFPYATPEQSERGMRLALTSPLLIGVLLCHIGSAVYSIISVNS